MWRWITNALAAVVIANLFAPSSARAQGNTWREVTAWTAPPSEARIPPRKSCAELRGLTGYDFSVISAAMIPAANGTPQFCRVLGLIQPEIKFEVALPLAWHERLLMTGNGGYAGEDLDAPLRRKTRDASIAAGFVFTQTNTGHEAQGEPLGAFAIDTQKLLDYGFRAVHVTAETAKRVAAAYYGKPPKRSYFVGCSTGGRQGLIAAQRFPSDFDGIVVGAPAFDFVSAVMSAVPIMQAVDRAPLSEDKLRLVGKIIYALCDEKDGLKDGIIDDPRQCDFKPSVHLPHCAAGDSPDCFTEGQLKTLETIYSDQFVGGRRVFPGWPVGPEAEGTISAPPDGAPMEGHVGWYTWIVRDDQPPSKQRYAEAFFRYLAGPEKRPNLKVPEIDLDREEPRLGWIRQVLNATDTNMGAFRDRGGKLLLYSGWADPALNPLKLIDYYESVRREMGPSTKDFSQLYLLPGVFHCSGGVGCDLAPRLSAVIDWVEHGRAPDRIIATQERSGEVVRSRPLCPYPQIAKYKESGDPDNADSFICTTGGGQPKE